MKNWLKIGVGVKRWLISLVLGSALIGFGLAALLIWMTGQVWGTQFDPYDSSMPLWAVAFILFIPGSILSAFSLYSLIQVIVSPFSTLDGRLATQLLTHRKQKGGPKIVAIGGGTGLSNLLRGLVDHTSNLTAIVTVADDGGSSGRLRREFGMLPPGDFRNNIAALSRDESLMTQLLQYRFGGKDEGLSGHAFGNLLITALVGLTGSFDDALLATERVLSIRGRVLPSTLTPVNLVADVEVNSKLKKIYGESSISNESGIIRNISIDPPDSRAYPGAIKAILAADLVILGPGSLFTSIIPNLLIQDIARAIESCKGKVVYVCNVSSQLGETDNYSVSDHVNRLSDFIAPSKIDYVLANTHIIELPVESQSRPVYLDQITNIKVIGADLIDTEKPWRHDGQKLANVVVTTLQ